MKPLLRSVLAVLLGWVVGSVAMMALHLLSGAIYGPAPRMSDSAAFQEYIGNLPPSAFLFVLAAHAAGNLAGAWVAAKVAGRAPLVHGLVVGGVFLICGIVNLLQIPHPAWFGPADLAAYLPAAYLGARLAANGNGRLREPAAAA